MFWVAVPPLIENGDGAVDRISLADTANRPASAHLNRCSPEGERDLESRYAFWHAVPRLNRTLLVDTAHIET